MDRRHSAVPSASTNLTAPSTPAVTSTAGQRSRSHLSGLLVLRGEGRCTTCLTESTMPGVRPQVRPPSARFGQRRRRDHRTSPPYAMLKPRPRNISGGVDSGIRATAMKTPSTTFTATTITPSARPDRRRETASAERLRADGARVDRIGHGHRHPRRPGHRRRLCPRWSLDRVVRPRVMLAVEDPGEVAIVRDGAGGSHRNCPIRSRSRSRARRVNRSAETALWIISDDERVIGQPRSRCGCPSGSPREIRG